MIQTSIETDNGTCATLAETLYISENYNAFLRFSQARIPVYARVVGYRLLSKTERLEDGCNLPINELAGLDAISRSMVIRSLKLLCDLNIFIKEEHKDKPCVYRLNAGEWAEYTMPVKEAKVVPIRPEIDNSTDVRDVGEEHQEPAPLLAPYVEHPSPIRSRDGEEYWEMPTNVDMDSGYAVAAIVKEEGITVQNAVSQCVKIAKETIKIAEQFKVDFSFLEPAKDICNKLLSAIAKPESSRPKKVRQPEDKEVSKTEWENNELANWWEANKKHYGDYRTYNQLSHSGGERYIVLNGEQKTISALRQESKKLALVI